MEGSISENSAEVELNDMHGDEGNANVLPRNSFCDVQDQFHNDVTVKQPRKFVFGEFFAGMGGLSTAVLEIGAGLVELGSIERLDAYDDQWNILDDEHFETGRRLCQTGLDHGHFAPPCRTLTEARRSDEHGSVVIMRSHQRPEGWGHPDADEANMIVERMVLLCMILTAAGKTFAIENPFASFLWVLRVVQRLIRLQNAELVLLHQCCYGAQTLKPTGMLTTAPWMKTVRGLCHEVRAHRHLKKGLAGRVWSYLEEKTVWRSSLSAEYPCGLCIAWAKALKTWLCSSQGVQRMEQHSMMVQGRWKNQLVRRSAMKAAVETNKAVQSVPSHVH